MKVIGIGLSKTGTTSLGRALEILGYENHYTYDLERLRLYSKGKIDELLDIASEGNNLEDWPWPLMYKELYSKYPDSKFILTIRKSSQIWYKSQCKHALRTGQTEAREIIFGYKMPHDFEKEHIEFYEKHNEDVINFFNENAPNNLLIFNVENGDGWEKLCEFLHQDIPNEEFPFLNRAVDFIKKTKSDEKSKDGIYITNPKAKKLLHLANRIKNKIGK